MEEEKEKYDYVNHPSHYNLYDIEVVDMIAKIWGNKACADWCKITAFKYRMRLGLKPDNSIEQDLNKEAVYLDLARKYNALEENSKVQRPDDKILLKD
jgi:hypothetical protein